jgi:hypothetical protein
MYGQASPQPIVTTTSACSARSRGKPDGLDLGEVDADLAHDRDDLGMHGALITNVGAARVASAERIVSIPRTVAGVAQPPGPRTRRPVIPREPTTVRLRDAIRASLSG